MAFDPYEFYKDMYEFEIDRMDNLNSSINIPITILVVLGGVLWFFLTGYALHCCLEWIDMVFIVLLAGSILSYIASIFCLLKSYRHPNYRLINNPSSFFTWRLELGASDLNDDGIDDAFEEGIINRFIDSADFNREINDNKSAWLYNSKSFLFYCIVFMLMTTIPFMIKNYNK